MSPPAEAEFGHEALMCLPIYVCGLPEAAVSIKIAQNRYVLNAWWNYL